MSGQARPRPATLWPQCLTERERRASRRAAAHCAGETREPVPFSLPDNDVVAAIDAPPTPLASPSPDERSVLLVHYESHPPISMLARPWLGLAGVRIDPVIGVPLRPPRFPRLSLLATNAIPWIVAVL